MSLYQPINIPIDLGKNELSPECAYFLGAIFSADESFIYEGKRYWLAPVRHNYGQDINKEIFEHMQLLQQIIGRANGMILTRDEIKARNWFSSAVISRAFATKQGFAAIFESEESTTIDFFLDDVRSAMDKSPQDVIQAFIVGAFDGRSAVDPDKAKNQIRYLALDCENLAAADYLRTLLEKLEIDFNYNTSRDRLEGGLPRKAQLRVKGSNMSIFMEKVGLVSPLKFALIHSMLDQNLFIHNNNRTLWGLKTLSSQPQNDATFEEIITPEWREYEFDLDTMLLEDLSKNLYGGDPNFSYSSTPKEKAELIDTKGRRSYRRDRTVAINALVLAKHKCEIDGNHPSFIRKNSNLLYSEPHHLVPLGFYAMFPVSLDVEENIVSLCSNCHNQLHYGKNIRPLLYELYEARKDLLRSVGIEITLQDLYKMYNA